FVWSREMIDIEKFGYLGQSEKVDHARVFLFPKFTGA
ncbi:unnamed protein product, partial [marine sediment metagenome]